MLAASAALALGAPPLANAQDTGPGRDPTIEQGSQRADETRSGLVTPGEHENAARAETIAGEVVRVDVGKGVIVLRTDEGERRVRAKPNRARELERGERFTGAAAKFGDQVWLAEERNPGVELAERGETRSQNGRVRAWDEAKGELVLATDRGERTFHMHPAEAAALHEGREVDVLYVDVEGEPWVVSVRDRGQRPVRHQGTGR